MNVYRIGLIIQLLVFVLYGQLQNPVINEPLSFTGDLKFHAGGTIEPVLMSKEGVSWGTSDTLDPEKNHKKGLYEMETPWAPKVAGNLPLPEYPRPLLQREKWLNLNGMWEFQEAKSGEGLPTSKKLKEQILVPYPWESKLSGIRRQLETQRAWYRRNFAIPPDWAGQNILLNFGAVDHESVVYINGKFAGSHKGGYDPFTFNITPYLKPGSLQEITVMVYDPGNEEGIAVGKQANDRFSAPGRYAYTPSSGIWQTVWIEPVSDIHADDLHIVTDNDQQQVSVTLFPPSQRINGEVIVKVLDGGQVVATGKGTMNQPVIIPLKNAKWWSPESPFLYDLDISVQKER